MASRSQDEMTYRAVFDGAGDAIIVSRRIKENGKYRIVEANQTACDRYGYSHEEIVGMSESSLYTPESFEKYLEVMSALNNAGQVIIEGVHLARDGRQIPTEINMRLVSIEGTLMVVSVCRDISERKEQERRQQEMLESERSQKAKLQAETDMRTNYTRALVHELKTPLTSLIASSDYLISQIKEEPLLSFAKNISFGAKSINHRIDELHDLIKLEIGVLKLDFYPVNMRQLLSDIAEFIKPAAERSELRFDVELPNKLPQVLGDRERLQQVIMNLLNNALKYTPKKGAVRLKAYANGDELTVEVQDTGCGIPANAQQAIFLPYEHRDASQHRKDGLGLGLAISKAIVERYKGRIWVESEPGRGSRFFVALPVRKRKKVESAHS